MAPLIILVASIALSTLAAPALAQDASVYKGVDEKGHVVYASSPKGLHNAQKVTLSEPAISGTVAPVAAVATVAPVAAGTAVAPAGPRVSPVLNTAAVIDTRSELASAQKYLDQALAEQDSGKEPLPGERVGTSTGGSHLVPAYFSRQDNLAKAVQAARTSLEKATSTR